MIRVGGAVPHFLNGWASDLQTREPITFGLCGFEPRPGWKLPLGSGRGCMGVWLWKSPLCMYVGR